MNEFTFENKKFYFQIIFIIYTALHDGFFPLLFYSINLICVSISVIVCLNKKYFNKKILKTQPGKCPIFQD
jgi:hypothetical protein